MPGFVKKITVILLALVLVGTLGLSCGGERTFQQAVFDGTITISAGGYYDIPFPWGNNFRLVVSFTVSGSSENNIVVLILVDRAYTDWVSGHEVTALYSSGQVTKGTFNVPIKLPSGGYTYHVVYSNRFSTLTKRVATTVNIEYHPVPE